MKDKLLILGINGFSGSHFINYIINHNLNNNFEIFGVDTKNSCFSKNVEIKYFQIDLTQKSGLEDLIISIKPKFIINFAGIFFSESFDDLYKINTEISYRICHTIVKNKIEVEKIVFIGSAAEYGKNKDLPLYEDSILNPCTNYGLSKKMQTDIFTYFYSTHKLNIVLARTFNLIGEGLHESLSIASFIKQIKAAKENDTIYTGNLNTKRDFLSITDAVDAYYKLLLNGKNGEVYNVCSGSSIKIFSILEHLIKLSRKKIEIKIKPELIKIFDIEDSYGDNSKIITDTSWKANKDILKYLENLI